MKHIAIFLLLIMFLPLAAGTFIPVSHFEDTQIEKLRISLRESSLLNLGSCVYDDNLWYNPGMNDSAPGIPTIGFDLGIGPRTEFNLQLYARQREPNTAMFGMIGIKHQLLDDVNWTLALKPSVGYTVNDFRPGYTEPQPFWGRTKGKQESQAVFTQITLICFHRKTGLNFVVDGNYARFDSNARHNVSPIFDDPVYQRFDYGQHNIYCGGLSLNYSFGAGALSITPEIGLNAFNLVNHPDDSFRISASGGIEFSLHWPSR
jgi:hypothetical protein